MQRPRKSGQQDGLQLTGTTGAKNLRHDVSSRKAFTLEVYDCHEALCHNASFVTQRGQSKATAPHVQSWDLHLPRDTGSAYDGSKKLLALTTMPQQLPP